MSDNPYDVGYSQASTVCPSCGEVAVQPVFDTTGVIVWYGFLACRDWFSLDNIHQSGATTEGD